VYSTEEYFGYINIFSFFGIHIFLIYQRVTLGWVGGVCSSVAPIAYSQTDLLYIVLSYNVKFKKVVAGFFTIKYLKITNKEK
jgi:hypothetical protein